MERRGLEFGVGLFLLIGLACLGYLSFKLGHLNLWGGSDYPVTAKFSTVAGLKDKAKVFMAGVAIGEVQSIGLKDGEAVVTLSINKDVKLEDDVIASIKTSGLIGDKYVSVTAGASDQYIKPGGAIRDTQPPLDIENLLGRFVFGSVEQPKGQGGEGKQDDGALR
ncbi:outer membrane lipid asymmetry maintenance protein MlaD [Syntrophobacter fumaroxidans]|uniref:Mammalian cell entry related domain protein n=1 Tax=Syntrophobacter fumaroxidans (strain DSM 10017 / MPOB) TaxID=335543 RepID=A0LFH2_SYNFM|nr:outer membrane lipid asymmetry maintenance protein MlaD [Syntrophobacter fumaroxidans]ABK16174.1 Mammalian cell entry related domain protein [Syntrophobacter fumaroxidans MPOB]